MGGGIQKNPTNKKPGFWDHLPVEKQILLGSLHLKMHFKIKLVQKLWRKGNLFPLSPASPILFWMSLGAIHTWMKKNIFVAANLIQYYKVPLDAKDTQDRIKYKLRRYPHTYFKFVPHSTSQHFPCLLLE